MSTLYSVALSYTVIIQSKIPKEHKIQNPDALCHTVLIKADTQAHTITFQKSGLQESKQKRCSDYPENIVTTNTELPQAFNLPKVVYYKKEKSVS